MSRADATEAVSQITHTEHLRRCSTRYVPASAARELLGEEWYAKLAVKYRAKIKGKVADRFCPSDVVRYLTERMEEVG